MTSKPRSLTAGAAARQLGISAKALRIYEQHGLISPGRTASGWRSYDVSDMDRLREIVQLRKLGFGLAEIGAILETDPVSRETVLVRQRHRLHHERQRLDATLRAIESTIAGQPRASGGRQLAGPLAFDLPWPWDGERFALPALWSLTFITGPLGSGKTRLAMRLAELLPDGRFLGLERLSLTMSSRGTTTDSAEAITRCPLVSRLSALSGATPSPALIILVEAIYAAAGPLVIDMVEQDLDRATQEALIALLRRDPPVHSLFLMTRSSAILDLSIAESGETIIYCPANHSPPMVVRPEPACPGYEAVAMCLASPDVRARSAGVIATFAAGSAAPGNDSRETFS